MDVRKWKMDYDDMVLKWPVGSGQFGVVVLAYLKREAASPAVTQYITRQTAPDGRPPPRLVAVKRFSGEDLPTAREGCCCQACTVVWSDYYIKFSVHQLL